MKNFYFALILLFVTTACKQRDKFSGIWLSFDDKSIDEWFKLREVFKSEKVRVTFFVTQPGSLTQNEVDKLKILKQDGHEISFHGNMHVVSEYYIKENGYKSYLKNEIESGLNLLDSIGFHCESFAYPYGAKYIFTDILLLRKFKFVRGVTPLNKEKDLSKIDDIYYSFDGDRSISSISFDNNSGLTREMIKAALDRAKKMKKY